MEQVVCSLTVQALATAPGTAPGWISVMNGSGDACKNGHDHRLEFGYGFGHAEGRGGLIGYGTGCGRDEVYDVASGRGDGNGRYEEIQF